MTTSTEEQFIGVVGAFRGADDNELLTRADLREFEFRLAAKIESAKLDIRGWLVVTQAALGGFIFVTLKFLR